MHVIIDKSDMLRVQKLLAVYEPDWPATMVRLGAAGLSWITRNFQLEGALAYRGNKWVHLAPVTIERRRNKGGPVRILQDTGELKQSATFRVRYAPQIQLDLGFTSVKAPGHHLGDPETRLPERRILPDKRQAEAMFVRVLIFGIRQNLAKAGYPPSGFGSLGGEPA